MVLCIGMWIGLSGVQAQSVYAFNPKYFKESFTSELGFSFLSHHVRSPKFENYYRSDGGDRPVYMRSFSILSMSYEPMFRLLEFGSKSSLSLGVPLTGALSTVDFRTPLGDKYDAEASMDFSASAERSASLGSMSVEAGGLLTYTIGAGATIENTSALGFSASVGYVRVQAPLLMSLLFQYDRLDYEDYDSWGHIVARLGLRTNRVMFYYMIGLNQQLTEYSNAQTTLLRTYNRFSIAIRFGK